MKPQIHLQIAVCAVAALLLVGCDSMPSAGQNVAQTQQSTGQNNAAQAAAAQAARQAQEAADKAEAERVARIADANQNARSAKFVAQNYSTQNDNGRTIVLKFQKNGRVVWDETADNAEAISHSGKWTVKGKQLRLSFFNKETKATENVSFEPKQALLSPREKNADCKALPGLLPVELNGEKGGLGNLYFWPQTQVKRNEGTCIAGKK